MAWVWAGSGGLLLGSVGAVYMAAGNHSDPANKRSNTKIAVGAGMLAGGDYLMWNGWQDIKSSKQRIGIHVRQNGAAFSYRKNWSARGGPRRAPDSSLCGLFSRFHGHLPYHVGPTSTNAPDYVEVRHTRLDECPQASTTTFY
jgi:hypothetical protein